MKKIDCILCHPRNKLHLYHRFVLSKVSWHFTVANLSKTWVVENVDNIVSSYVRQWLELPISSTLSTLVVPNTKCGLGSTLPSTKFMLCHTVIQNALKSSPNKDINSLWAQTSFGCNIQYDQFQNTKQVLNTTQKDSEARISHELKAAFTQDFRTVLHGTFPCRYGNGFLFIRCLGTVLCRTVPFKAFTHE